MKDAGAVVAAVAERGLLFLSDPKRPSAIHVLTGEYPRGSWWSHPQANAIYDILQTVEDHPDLVRQYNVRGVPKVVINDSVEFVGALPESQFLEYVQSAVKNPNGDGE